MVCYFVRPQIKNAFDVVAILYVIQFKTLENSAFSFSLLLKLYPHEIRGN